MYPEIDAHHFFRLCDQMEKATKFTAWEQDTRADLLGLNKVAKRELLFIRSTRNDDTLGLKSALCRSEFLEAIVRLAVNVYFPDTANGNPFAALTMLIENLIKPFTQKSEIPNKRALIQSDQQVNDFLYDNR